MTEKVTLTELQLIIRDSLYLALPDFYWVMAEIAELKDNSAGHCYLELIEKNADEKNAKARVRAIIWSNRYRFLKAFFENSTGETLKEGLKVLVKIKVEYHELYGLSLIISDIDPAFTIGEMAIRRQLIIKRLEQEGILTMNKDLSFPFVPQRIAIISSQNAAGYTDFINQLTSNSFGYVFYTALFESSLQGAETEQGVINALDRIALSSELFDLVTIIRGGGSQSDLSWFDNYNIAYHVTQFPLPVLTGIGHDKDVSVTDMVAYLSLKTPTAVADYIIDTISTTENEIIKTGSDIVDASRIIIEKNKTRINTSAIRIFPVARIMIGGVKDRLSHRIIELNNRGKELIYKATLIPEKSKSRLLTSIKSLISEKGGSLERSRYNISSATLSLITVNNVKVKSLEGTLQLLKPENVLQRGYSITSVNGKTIRDCSQVSEGDVIKTRFNDGAISSKVLEMEETGKQKNK
jgi:exodeoxyribonuclease VII large subunit